MAADSVVLGIIIGTLAAIVYSLRVLILLERRIARVDLNIESLTQRVLREELSISRNEEMISRKEDDIFSKIALMEKELATKLKSLPSKKVVKKSTKKPVKKAVKKVAKKATKKVSKRKK
jgi:biopolymer transport protein ExbB/TolQ